MKFWQEFGISLASDVIGTIITITLPLVVLFLIFRRRRRTPVLRFFGLDSRSGGRICIRLSNIYVREKGTFGVTGIDLGFNGPAVTEGEYRSAEKLAAAVRQRPLPRGVQAFATFLGIRFVDTNVECDIRSSPRYVDGVTPYTPVNGDCTCALSGAQCSHDGRDDGFERRTRALEARPGLRARIDRVFQSKDRGKRRTFVLIGAPTYNVLTHYVHVTTADRRLDFVRVRNTLGSDVRYERGIRFPGPDGPEELRREELRRRDGTCYAYTEYVTIQKITRFGPGMLTVFVCAGTCTSATAEAVRLLADWENLLALPNPRSTNERRIGDDEDFLLVYSFQTPHRELGDVDAGRDTPPAAALCHAWSPSLGHWKPRPGHDDDDDD